MWIFKLDYKVNIETLHKHQVVVSKLGVKGKLTTRMLEVIAQHKNTSFWDWLLYQQPSFKLY